MVMRTRQANLTNEIVQPDTENEPPSEAAAAIRFRVFRVFRGSQPPWPSIENIDNRFAETGCPALPAV